MKSRGLLEPNHRILVIDDNHAIHADLRKILLGELKAQERLQDDESFFFGLEAVPVTTFQIDSAFQGQEGLAKLEQSLAEGRPYALAFVDIRMPPGWDGVETITHLWKAYPDATRMGWRGNHHSPLEGVSEPAGGSVHRLLGLFLE